MDDFKILGIATTDDLKTVKEAFRARAKELHPDSGRARAAHLSNEEELRLHLLFIAVTQAYHRIIASIDASHGSKPKAEIELPRAPRPPASSLNERSSSPVLHGDPAYVLYRTGMRYYMAIHPSAWDLGPRVLSDGASAKGREEEEMRAKVADLVRLFPKAYYYFSLVDAEHPDSPWAADAREKMAVIERRTPSYKRILESFGAWRRAGAERGREIAGIVKRTKRLLDEEGGELRWPSGDGAEK